MSSSSQYPNNWDTIRKRVYKRDGYRCKSCGAGGGSNGNTTLHAHHKKPIADGGSHRMSNLTTLCPSCHNDRHDHDLLAWSNSSTNQSNTIAPEAQDAYSHIPGNREIYTDDTGWYENNQKEPEVTDIVVGIVILLVIAVLMITYYQIIISGIIAILFLYFMTH